MVNINKYIKALLHPAGGHQGSHKAHQAGNFPQSRVTCGFQVHLHSLQCMLPYFAASGTNCYTKSVNLNLEKIYSFERKHPEMYTS